MVTRSLDGIFPQNMMDSFNLHVMILIHHSVLLTGAYVVQDAVYLEKQSDALMIASQKEPSMEFREFLTGTAIKYMG